MFPRNACRDSFLVHFSLTTFTRVLGVNFTSKLVDRLVIDAPKTKLRNILLSFQSCPTVLCPNIFSAK